MLPYLVGVASAVRFRRAEDVERDPGTEMPPPYPGRGRPRRPRRLEDRIPSSPAGALLGSLPADSWETIAWRAGARGPLGKQAIRLRVHRVGYRGAATTTEGWLIGERPLPGHQSEANYYFAWGLAALALDGLVESAHCRWIVERFYQDAKGELGLDDYEGRLWPGLHRHVALVMLAHCYLTLRRSYSDAPPRPPPAAPLTTPAPLHTPVRVFPPQGRTSLAALRRDVLAELFLQVIKAVMTSDEEEPHK